MTAPVITTRSLTLGYPGKVTLRDGNISIGPGQVTCIIGGSGCGKSTLLKALIGLLPPLEGEVEILGRPLYSLDEKEQEQLLSRLGVLFQNGALLNSMSVLENVKIPLREHARLPEVIMDEISLLKLRQVELEHAAHLAPSELSGGMRKRAALARAVALDPEILFCDEPSAGLDPVTGAGLDELILNLKRVLGISIVVVTHELMSIKRIADKIIMLAPGEIVFQGDLAQALSSDIPLVKGFFGRQTAGQGQTGSLLAALEGGTI